MFDISIWLTENLISSVARGVFARERVAIMATDYMLKGVLTAAQVEQIALATALAVEPVPDEEVQEGE